jgi:membrane-associated protease RseP (regulator of RpoE activity)
VQPSSPARRSSSRTGPITILLLLVGIGFGIGLIALLAHSIYVSQHTTIHPASSSAQPILGVIVDGTLTVITVDSGRAADLAGIHPRDVLDAFNGQPIASAPTARQAERAALAGQHGAPELITVTVTRGGRKLNLLVHPADSTNSPTPGTPQITPTPAYGNLWYL